MKFWAVWAIILLGFVSLHLSFLFAGLYIGWKLASLLVD